MVMSMPTSFAGIVLEMPGRLVLPVPTITCRDRARCATGCRDAAWAAAFCVSTAAITPAVASPAIPNFRKSRLPDVSFTATSFGVVFPFAQTDTRL